MTMTLRRQAFWRALVSMRDPGAGPRPDPEDLRAHVADVAYREHVLAGGDPSGMSAPDGDPMRREAM